MLPNGWSVKDVLAHIAWGEREGIRVIGERALVGSELWDLSEDERNAAVVRASQSRELDDVLAEYRTVFDEYVAAIAQLSDEVLDEPRSIRGLPERILGWPPWRVFYDPGHYEATKQPSQKDGLGRMCKTHWNQDTAGLARDAAFAVLRCEPIPGRGGRAHRRRPRRLDRGGQSGNGAWGRSRRTRLRDNDRSRTHAFRSSIVHRDATVRAARGTYPTHPRPM